MAKTSISWTDYSWNPWFPIWGKDTPRRHMSDVYWAEPLKWNRDAGAAGKRKRVFCGSMCDVMEENSDLSLPRKRLYDLIEATPNLDWLLLTKRPQNFRRFLPNKWLVEPRPNVWGMTTVESGEYLWRASELINTPFVIRGVSYEPALGPVSFERWTERGLECGNCKWAGVEGDAVEAGPEDDRGFACPWCNEMCAHTPLDELLGAPNGIGWIIVGGESGPGARPMHPAWARSVRDQCQAAGVAFHFKQWGDWSPMTRTDGVQKLPFGDYYPDTKFGFTRLGKKKAGRLLDGREWQEFPR